MENHLFNQTLLKKYSKSYNLNPTKHDLLKEYISKIDRGDFKSETKNYLNFYDIILKGILGYKREDVLFDEKGDVGTGRSEFVLTSKDKKFMVIELKGQGIDLDKRQSGRSDNKSPVEQAFGYAINTGDVDWIMVSNYDEFRLYNYYEKTKYISFTARELLDKETFAFFMLAFSRESHIESGYINEVKDGTLTVDRKLASEFYKLYNETRLMLIKELETVNQMERLDAIHYSQLILNRYMFICFAEDTNLLPPQISIDTISTPIQKGNIRHRSIWQRLNELCLDINEGNEFKKISEYNGGLFAEDLDFIKIRDIVDDQSIFNDVYQNWNFTEYEKDITHLLGTAKDRINPIYRNMLTISSFDFSTELDVNILGHIFENSIGDIEELKEDSKGRRKKEGIFYTPDYITDYICRNTIIPYLSQSGDKSTVKDLIGEYWGSKIEDLDQKVKNIKIVDPACGSGAFLNKAADILLEIHEAIHETRYKDKKSTLTPYFDNIGERREILLNNIYGVDLNEESTEITKLSLFLKVSRKGLKLPNLNDNIKCGNSLIDDPKYTDKPFKWREEFPDIFLDGGFDIVIGNPPYFNIRTLGAKSPEMDFIMQNYPEVYMDKSDILFYFITKGIEISKRYVSFIVSNAFLFAEKGQKLRNYILHQTSIVNIVNFERYKVFDDASITTAIFKLDKLKNDKKTKVVSLKKSNYSANTIIDLINDSNNFFDVSFKKDDVFALLDDNIVSLNKKIDKNHPLLGQLLFVGKGMETAANKVFTFKEMPSFPSEFIKKRMNGDIIRRYAIAKEKEYLLYVEDQDNFEDLPKEVQIHLLNNKKPLENRFTVKNEGRPWWKYSRAVHKKYYKFNKIWSPYRSKENRFALDETNEFIGLTNTSVIFGCNAEISLKYILALLNSKLLNFRYKSIGKQTGSGIYEYFEYQISKLPIPKISFNDQEPLIKKVDRLLQLNKELNEEFTGFKNWIQKEFRIKQLSKKLHTYYKLSEDQFITELRKLKVDTKSRKNREYLEREFSESLAIIKPLLQEIEQTDNEIDQMVYKLYGLNDEEIIIIEDS
ncbi:Eco57I restriction-modification methylase domain-containing protein [Methanobacterium formicicum]|uniref:site-specific DNA-methyltransferase (adenine-specific) n=1 Tax=Methanobacterium formicicum (strain DSM 3637 / PP1) TaxID=1204725 RepID=K2QFT5_METFP|nr:N-6 DNA methylase [Methanobacterium formicicum]EKF86936.1 type II restriction enzyme, methylase subunit [Methanobacterium formicicum DSM 3637]